MPNPTHDQQVALSPITDTLGRVWVYYPDGQWSTLGMVATWETTWETLIKTALPDSERARIESHLTPAADVPIETGLGESVDLEHDGAMLAALSTGQGDAINATGYWAELADTLTKVRAEAIQWLPSLPDGHEEWFFEREPILPFERGELFNELRALSGLITKAHTVAAIYRAEAARLDDEYAEATASQPIEVDHRAEACTPAELAAIQRETEYDEAEADRLEAEQRARS